MLSQAENYEDITAESRFEETTITTNHVQDVTEMLEFSRADLREKRKWNVDKKKLVDERASDIVKDLSMSIIYTRTIGPAVFFKMGADIMDVFPAKKIHDVTPPQNYGDIGKKAAKSAEEARRLAEQQQDDEDSDD